MEKVEIKKLIEQCLNYFYESGYAKGTIDYYKCLWTKGILQYMSDKGIDMYTPDVGAKFIESTQHQDMSNHECERIRSIHALNDIMTVGYIRKQCVRAAFYPLDGAIGKQMEKLVLHLISLRRGKNTLKHYRSCLGNFLYYLDMIGVQNIKQITEEHVIRFLSSQQLNREKTLSIIRCLFLFWRQENIIDGRFEEFFATYKLRKKERIPSYYTTEEIKVIENSVILELNQMFAIRVERKKLKISRKEDILWRFLSLLTQHYKENRSVDFYADKLCISPKHLSSVIKQLSHKTAHEIISDVVIMAAKQLLKTTTLSIQEISEELNFANQSFFGKFFKQNTGQSPSSYRGE